MSKIIKVSTDLEVTVHDYPEGMLETQNRQLCELIGDGVRHGRKCYAGKDFTESWDTQPRY